MSEIRRRLVSIPDARAELGGIGHTTIYDLFKDNQLVKVNIGRRSFVTSESLAAYVDRITAASAVGAGNGSLSAPDRKGLIEQRLAGLDGA